MQCPIDQTIKGEWSWPIILGENGEKIEFFWRVSKLYLIKRKMIYVTKWCPLWWPRRLLKGSYLEQVLVVKWETSLKFVGGRQLSHQCMKSGMLPNYAPCCGLEAYWRRVRNDILFLVKWGQNLESICIEGQGHIVTFDFIFSWSMCHANGPCVQWMVFLSTWVHPWSKKSWIENRFLLIPSSIWQFISNWRFSSWWNLVGNF